jgi:hypothetical protein
MENKKNDNNETPALQGVDLWRAILEENDRRYIQKHILSETSFESSGDESEESDSSSSASNLSECAAIQRTLELENSFSSDGSLDLSAAIQRTLELENSFSSDGSLDLSAISISDVKRATCDCCWRFFHAQYVRARTRKSLIAMAITGTGTTYLIVDDNTMPLLKECCIEYYDRWL